MLGSYTRMYISDVCYRSQHSYKTVETLGHIDAVNSFLGQNNVKIKASNKKRSKTRSMAVLS